MQTGYTVGQTAKILGISNTSVRNYSKWFSEFFSETAVPEAGQLRMFDHADLATLATIARLKKKQNNDENIIATLASGERDTVAMSEEEEPKQNERQAPVNELALRLSASLARSEGELSATQSERDRLLVDLATERDARREAEKAAAAANAQLEILKEMTEEKKEVEPVKLSWWKRTFG